MNLRQISNFLDALSKLVQIPLVKRGELRDNRRKLTQQLRRAAFPVLPAVIAAGPLPSRLLQISSRRQPIVPSLSDPCSQLIARSFALLLEPPLKAVKLPARFTARPRHIRHASAQRPAQTLQFPD